MNSNAINWQIVGMLNSMSLERTTVSLRDAWTVGVLRSLTLTREGWQVWAEDVGQFVLTFNADALLFGLTHCPTADDFLHWMDI